METSIQKLAHIAFERTSKTNTEQQKPNKPASIQADQNIAKPPSQQLGSPHCQKGRRQGRSLKIFLGKCRNMCPREAEKAADIYTRSSTLQLFATLPT